MLLKASVSLELRPTPAPAILHRLRAAAAVVVVVGRRVPTTPKVGDAFVFRIDSEEIVGVEGLAVG